MTRLIRQCLSSLPQLIRPNRTFSGLQTPRVLTRCLSSTREDIMACLPFYAKGEVVKGFGRGSKELGIPTANMPESVVNSLPPPMTTGIYYGLSNVDGGAIFKTVLSIGWNPYYKNTKKSLEAHLIHDFKEDFYGSELKLVILGYIRPEKNFDSLEALIDAIHNDIKEAKTELDKPEVLSYRTDSFFSKSGPTNSNDTPNGSQ